MFRPLPALCIAATLILSINPSPTGGQAVDTSGVAANEPLNLTSGAQAGNSPPASSARTDQPPVEASSSAQPKERKSRPLGSPGDNQNHLSLSVPGSTTGGTASEAPTPRLKSNLPEDSPGSELTRVGFALIVVLVALFGIRALFRRMGGMSGVAGGGRPSGVMEILARYPVARGQQLIILKLARRVLLVHQNGADMSTLTELTDEDEVADLLRRVESGARKTGTNGFRAALERFSSDHHATDPNSGSVPGDHPGSLHTQVIDLTRTHEHSFLRFLGRKGSVK